MATGNKDQNACLGFLTVVEKPSIGFIGGYLLLNLQTRPIEFHCTAPVNANRPQEILYGVALRDFLFGELIGKTLVERSKLAPEFIVTNRREIIESRSDYDVPIVRFHTDASEGNFTLDTPAKEDSQGGETRAFSVSPDFPDDRRIASTVANRIGRRIDWSEPFERIQLAISEAHQRAAA